MKKKYYHFTALEYLNSIRVDGLSKGDVPTGPGTGTNGIWLTTDATAIGHGLDRGGILTLEERLQYQNVFGALPPEGARYPNKLAARITITNLPREGKLVRWSRWGRRNCEPDFYDALVKANGKRHSTWFVFMGAIIPSHCFGEIVTL